MDLVHKFVSFQLWEALRFVKKQEYVASLPKVVQEKLNSFEVTFFILKSTFTQISFGLIGMNSLCAFFILKNLVICINYT